MVIIVFGLPGSGKSYFASRLAVKLKARYVNSDELRMKLFPERTYSDAEKKIIYDKMLTAMSEAISKKDPIVLDATFYKASLRNKFEKTAERLREKIIYIEVTAPEKTIEARLNIPRQYSEANVDVYRKLKEMAEPLTEEHLVLISSDNNLSSMLCEAIQYLDTFK